MHKHSDFVAISRKDQAGKRSQASIDWKFIERNRGIRRKKGSN